MGLFEPAPGPGVDHGDPLSSAAKGRLGIFRAVPSDYLSVNVEKGWATISGEVTRSYQKSCAEADVYRVFGVRGVSNEIEIKVTGGQSASEHLAQEKNRAPLLALCAARG